MQLQVAQRRQEEARLAWPAHWLVHLQRGRLKSVIVVSTCLVLIYVAYADLSADDESDKDDW